MPGRVLLSRVYRHTMDGVRQNKSALEYLFPRAIIDCRQLLLPSALIVYGYENRYNYALIRYLERSVTELFNKYYDHISG